MAEPSTTPEKNDIPKDENKPEENDRTAIALRYDVEKDRAPFVIAAGRGPIAEEILRIAGDKNIPLYEDPEMARILNKLQIDTEIPPELYTLVAEVLFFVYKLERMAAKRQKVVKKLKEEQREELRQKKSI